MPFDNFPIKYNKNTYLRNGTVNILIKKLLNNLLSFRKTAPLTKQNHLF